MADRRLWPVFFRHSCPRLDCYVFDGAIRRQAESTYLTKSLDLPDKSILTPFQCLYKEADAARPAPGLAAVQIGALAHPIGISTMTPDGPWQALAKALFDG